MPVPGYNPYMAGANDYLTSDDDDSFGFYSRPTKAHIIAAGIRRTA